MDNNDPPQPAPLFRISLVKEMFPGLFADPYRHRVHNVAGFMDFNAGRFTNARVLEIDGIPTIVSTGQEECHWVSQECELPESISIDALAWELATSKLSPPTSFSYEIGLVIRDARSGADLDVVIDNGGEMFPANAPRARAGLNFRNVGSFWVSLRARVFEDSYLTERHLPGINENVGRPLLRAINVLEPVQSIYEINSLMELQSLCSEFRFFDTPGPELTRLIATLDLNAVLVNSVNQFIQPDNVPTNPALDIYHPGSKYEHIELQVLNPDFTTFEAKIIGVELRREVN
jgi:hypothetical protein